MLVIYDRTKGWEQYQRNVIRIIHAVIGTKEELRVPGNNENKPYQWAVPQPHESPLANEASGHVDTLEEAKEKAEIFLQRIDRIHGRHNEPINS